jgi:hypothetical protein
VPLWQSPFVAQLAVSLLFLISLSKTMRFNKGCNDTTHMHPR